MSRPTAAEIVALIKAMPPTLSNWMDVLGAVETSMAQFDAQDFRGNFGRAQELLLDAYVALEDSAPNHESERSQRGNAAWIPNQPRTV